MGFDVGPGRAKRRHMPRPRWLIFLGALAVGGLFAGCSSDACLNPQPEPPCCSANPAGTAGTAGSTSTATTGAGGGTGTDTVTTGSSTGTSTGTGGAGGSVGTGGGGGAAGTGGDASTIDGGMPDGPKDAGADVPAEGDAGAGDARHDA